MRIAKRIILFVMVNILIVTTISIVTSLLGVKPYLNAQGLNYQSLIIFCLMWGFAGSFISLALSRVMAKWTMGVRVIDVSSEANPELRRLVGRVHEFAQRAGLRVMPEVGYYEADDLNAFATGPTRNRSLVAVSTGLLRNMNATEVDGVLAHEVAHIANGDMVTMTLLQGVVNAFVMFLARVAAFFASQLVAEERRPLVQMVVTIGLELVLGVLGMIVVATFSRFREYRADSGGANLAGRDQMISALERLKANLGLPDNEEAHPAMASLQISGKAGGFMSLFSTHPDLNDRIERLRSLPRTSLL